MDYFAQLCIMVAIYGMLAVSMDLIAGQTGLLTMAHAGFFGVGAYVSALLTLRMGCGYPLAAFAGAMGGFGISFVFSLPAMRLNREDFVIGTFVLQLVLFDILSNWTDVTRGSLGIRGIPYPRIFGWSVNSSWAFLVVAICFLTFECLFVSRITSSPFGRVLRAIREDEALAQSLGKRTLYFKVSAFAVSAVFAALAGSLYAHYITYIDPTSFTIMESILILSMVIIGGTGTLWGPLLGATILVTLPEALRFIGLRGASGPNVREMIYGILLVVMIVLRPRGLVGKYAIGR